MSEFKFKMNDRVRHTPTGLTGPVAGRNQSYVDGEVVSTYFVYFDSPKKGESDNSDWSPESDFVSVATHEPS